MRFLLQLNIFVCLGYAATLVVQVNGMSTNRTQFCIGEVLTFVCSLENIRTFNWRVGSLIGVIGWFGVPGEGATYNWRFKMFNITTAASGTNTISTLQVAAFPGLNGTLVTCANAIISAQKQSGIVVVLGK